MQNTFFVVLILLFLCAFMPDANQRILTIGCACLLLAAIFLLCRSAFVANLHDQLIQKLKCRSSETDQN